MDINRTTDAHSNNGRQTVQAHWYSTGAAARILGISESAVRQRVAAGELTSIRAGRGRRVLLIGDLPAGKTDRPAPPAAPPTDGEALLVRTSESLSALIRDLQRQSLALAAQIGYLQHQLAEAQESARTLAERRENTVESVPPESVAREEHQEALGEIERLRAALDASEARSAPVPRRRWWWRR